jgi:heat shock protein HslJ
MPGTRRVTTVLVGALILAGCGSAARPDGAQSSPGDAVSAGDRLVDGVAGAWALQEGTVDGAAIPMPAQARGTLVFADGRISGVSFCNGYGAAYELAGTELVLSDDASTLIGCDGDVGAAESAYAGVLFGGGLQVALDDSGLTLTGNRGTLHFYRLPPVPVADVTGVRWVLDSLQTGGTAASAVGPPAVLALRDDGTATISTGCREFEASWETRGDSVVLTDYAYDDIGCVDPVGEQDRLLLQLLTGGFQVAVDGSTLTVSDVDAHGTDQPVAVYRAT